MIATSNYITISDSASSVPLALSTQFPAIKLAGALVLAVACSTSGLNVYVDPTMRGDTPQFLVSQQDSFGLEASAITYNGNTLTERRVDMKSQGDNLQELISFLKLEENWDYQGASLRKYKGYYFVFLFSLNLCLPQGIVFNLSMKQRKATIWKLNFLPLVKQSF